MTEWERRTLGGTVEVRSDGDNGPGASGYAAMFDRLSQNLGGFVERVAPGAFAKTIREQDVRALFNHEEQHVLGRLSAGTLRLSEDDTGLRYEVDLPDTTSGRDVAELLRRGDITGSSFGFRVVADEWGETDDGFPLRTLLQVSLRDVGPVTFPAYSDSTVALRSLAVSRALPLDDVVGASQRGELSDLLNRSHPDTAQDRETPIVRRQRLGWLTS